MKKKFVTKEDRAALFAAKKVLKKIAHKAAKLNAIRREADSVPPVERDSENGKKWKKASLELYGLLDEIEGTGLGITFARGSVDFTLTVPVVRVA